MPKNPKVNRLTKMQQTDVRTAWRIVGEQIGRTIREGAQTGRVVTDGHGRPISRDQPQRKPVAAEALVGVVPSR